MKLKSSFRRYFIILIIISLYSCTKSAEKDIDFISLKINSWKKSDYNNVLIYIEKEKNNSNFVELKVIHLLAETGFLYQPSFSRVKEATEPLWCV